MSDLPAEDLGYQAVVAEFFLGLRGSGLLLSPLDQELVAEWERRGLPVPVVCRGIRHGLAQAEERRTRARSLRALRFAVEDEWRAYQSGRVGDAPAPTLTADEAAARRLCEAREILAAGAARPGALGAAYREAQRALALALALDGAGAGAGAGPGSPADRAEVALTAADASLLAGWLASLSRPERAALGARLRALAGARRPGESPRAHRRSLRAHLLDLGRQAGLTWLGGSV